MDLSAPNRRGGRNADAGPTREFLKQLSNFMFKKKCPQCGARLGDFLYADACPHCHEVLKHNQAKPSPAKKTAQPRSWPLRAFFSIVRFVES